MAGILLVAKSTTRPLQAVGAAEFCATLYNVRLLVHASSPYTDLCLDICMPLQRNPSTLLNVGEYHNCGNLAYGTGKIKKLREEHTQIKQRKLEGVKSEGTNKETGAKLIWRHSNS